MRGYVKARCCRYACATLTENGISVSVEVIFAESGEIATVAITRYRDVAGRQVLTPWRGHFTDYKNIDDMMIPMSARVEWVPQDGAVEVWRGRITGASFFAASTVRRNAWVGDRWQAK